MSNTPIDLACLGVDELGRVVLSDDLLVRLEECASIVSAGANLSCPNSSNTNCTNGACGGSTNGSCTNQISCGGASNARFCYGGPIE
jgi:hypothetical protein